ncbi:MAG: hypothetical protein K8L99_08725 [Anaerolineae bacterium]|nr:hypothetical protein [Anaerolineae bacterium]
MRIQVRWPKFQPDEFQVPEQCPYENCSGNVFKPHGRRGEAKAVRDTDHEEVASRRHRCVTCGCTLRVYPTGISQAQQSVRLKAKMQQGKQRAVIGADGTFLKVSGQQVGIEVVVDDMTGELLGLDTTTSESAQEIQLV